MFKITGNKYDSELALKNKVDNNLVNLYNVKYFDNDGFELSSLEQEFYKANNIVLNSCLNHTCCQREWLVYENDNFFLDHSLILQRFYFTEEAKAQLLSKSKELPQLNKYIKLKPKWGFDFALEYYYENEVIEVMHIEMDFNNYNNALEAISKAESKILSTDWEHFTNSLKLSKSEWQYLPGMEQNDWKARHWGLEKAEFTQKAFQ